MRVSRRTFSRLGLVVLVMSCAGRSTREENGVAASRPIEEVLAKHTDSLMALPGVVGTAIGLCDDKPCIRVLLADSAAAARLKIPEQLEGHRVRVEVTGPIRAR